MAQLLFCTVSAVNQDETVDVAIEERENLVKTDVPVLDTVYHMPVPGDTVVAIFDDANGELQRGIVIGRPYHQSSVLEASAQKVRVKHLEADSIIYHGSCEKG